VVVVAVITTTPPRVSMSCRKGPVAYGKRAGEAVKVGVNFDEASTKPCDTSFSEFELPQKRKAGGHTLLINKISPLLAPGAPLAHPKDKVPK
jgi:hypothetical protein